MKIIKECQSCMQSVAKFVCKKCGRYVCEQCYNKVANICMVCGHGKTIKK